MRWRRRIGPISAGRQCAQRYDEHAAVPQEIGRRLLQRLDYVRVTPEWILDVGAGTGAALTALQERYRQARIVALDSQPEMLGLARDKARTLRRFLPGKGTLAIAANSLALPVHSDSADLLWSNLMLSHVPDVPAVFAEWHRVLRQGGLLMFATLGPDTLRELRTAAGHLASPYPDMHDLGDALVAAGFSDPVMDMERLTLTYPELSDFLREWRALRGRLPQCGAGLRATTAWRRLESAYPRGAHAPRWPVTVEVVYGHAWKLATKATGKNVQGAPTTLHFHPRRP